MRTITVEGIKWKLPTKLVPCSRLWAPEHTAPNRYCNTCDNTRKQKIIDEDALTPEQKAAYANWQLTNQMTSFW